MESTEQVTGEKAHPAPGCAPAPTLLSVAALTTAQFVGAIVAYYDQLGRPLPDLGEHGSDRDA